jgi:hypothetical protein
MQYMGLRKNGSELPSSQVSASMIEYIPRGPIAQWLEQSAHKCAHVLTSPLSSYEGGTGIRVPKAQPYLAGKPKGDSSMVGKVRCGSTKGAKRTGS